MAGVGGDASSAALGGLFLLMRRWLQPWLFDRRLRNDALVSVLNDFLCERRLSSSLRDADHGWDVGLCGPADSNARSRRASQPCCSSCWAAPPG